MNIDLAKVHTHNILEYYPIVDEKPYSRPSIYWRKI
jgi:hypothetical protein